MFLKLGIFKILILLSGITLLRVTIGVDKLEYNGLTDILCLLEVLDINCNVWHD